MSTLLLRNAKLFGSNKLHNISIEHGKIQSVEDCKTEAEQAQIVDLEGRWLLPAFCDSHMHFHYAAQSKSILQLPPNSSIAEISKLIADCLLEIDNESWLIASGWQSDLLSQLGDGVEEWLEGLSDSAAIYMWSLDHHRALVNPLAAKKLGLSAEKYLLVERATEICWNKIPKPKVDLFRASHEMHSHGITALSTFDRADSFHDLSQFHEQGNLQLRISHGIAWQDFLRQPEQGYGAFSSDPESMLKQAWVKIFLDGTLGSRTAWMAEDYCDDSGNIGIQRHTDKELFEGLELVAKAQASIAIHAIGDEAVAQAIRCILYLRKLRLKLGQPKPLLSDRIEHAQVMSEESFELIAEHKIPLSVQPCHLLADFKVATSRWGDRCKRMLPLKSFQEAGIAMCLGTDYPIEVVDPWVNLQAAVNRWDSSGLQSKKYFPGQAIDFAAAIKAYTEGAARHNLLPELWGQVRLGAPADLQILACEQPEEVCSIEQAQLQGVLLNGRPVFQNALDLSAEALDD